MEKNLTYNVKYFDTKWNYAGMVTLNPDLSEEEKEKKRKEIMEQFNIPQDALLNISNNVDVYF